MSAQSSWRRFLADLKRRKVYRVAAVYAATAFVLVQVADLTFERLTLPPWTVTLVIVLALLGFPVAVVLAWAFEVTPEGVRRTEPGSAQSAHAPLEGERAGSPGSPAFRTRTVLALAAGASMLAAGGWWLYGADGGSGPTVDRLAVLPLTNLMNDPEQAHFVQGMHEGIISELQEAGVPVIARTSVMTYADGQTPAREIARELNVGALVEASVLRLGDSVEIEARLVDPTTEEAVWRASFGESLGNVVTLHRDVTRAIADEIQAALSPEDEARLAETDPVVPESYEAYLRGVHHAQSFTPEDFDRALEYFLTALDIDSTYAPAYVGVARVWQFRAQATAQTGVTAAEAREHLRPALERALELDPDLPEAHLALAWAETWNDWDVEEGRAAFRRVLQLNPGHAEARAFYGHLLTILGRWDAAREQMRRAVELDPLNPFIQGLHGVQLVSARRYSEAVAVLEELFTQHPDAVFPRDALVEAYERTGRIDRAVDALRDQLEAQGDREALAAFQRAHREGGYEEGLRQLAVLAVSRAEEAPVRAGIAAARCAAAGMEEAALDWLERAFEAHTQNMPYIGVAPTYEPLHDEPRFRELARRVGVPILTGPAEE